MSGLYFVGAFKCGRSHKETCQVNIDLSDCVKHRNSRLTPPPPPPPQKNFKFSDENFLLPIYFPKLVTCPSYLKLLLFLLLRSLCPPTPCSQIPSICERYFVTLHVMWLLIMLFSSTSCNFLFSTLLFPQSSVGGPM